MAQSGSPMQDGLGEKVDGGQEMTVIVSLWQNKILITTIQVNFVLIPSEAGMRQHKLT